MGAGLAVLHISTVLLQPGNSCGRLPQCSVLATPLSERYGLAVTGYSVATVPVSESTDRVG